jgi:hypothetical protein
MSGNKHGRCGNNLDASIHLQEKRKGKRTAANRPPQGKIAEILFALTYPLTPENALNSFKKEV